MYHGEVQIQLYLGCVMSSRGVHEKQGTKITGLSFLQANRIVEEKRTYEKIEVFFVSRAHSEKMSFYSVLDAVLQLGCTSPPRHKMDPKDDVLIH